MTVNSIGERGLLGVAFDPDFQTNGFVYIYYTATTPAIHNRVSRVTANGDVAVAGSESILLELDNLSGATNHNGGALHFGPDGKLYIAVGENANGNNSQTLTNLLGKILRIDSNGAIPTDNPFFNQTSGRNRAIWALGLRNPFTFGFQNGTGRMFINDVGQNSWEEINDGLSGSNYGWPTTEGGTTVPGFVSPLYAYGHGGGTTEGCAITGGAFYNPPTVRFPSSYIGKYFFADYCNGWIRRYDPTSDTAAGFATGAGNVVDLAVSGSGKLYYLNRSSVFEVDSTVNPAPQITTHPQNRTVAAGQPVTFSVTATGTAPLNYQWERNNSTIAGATSSTYTISSVLMADNGAQFRCRVTNSFGEAISNSATLTVTSNQAPTATIASPAAGTLYTGGQTIAFAGSGADPEDGTLPPGAFTWSIDFHHDTHTHPAMLPTSGMTSGSYTIPDSGETSANVFYRIYLTVRDSAGLTRTTSRDVQPRKATITLGSQPTGARLTLDGQPMTAPLSFLGVVGMKRTIGALSPQTVNGQQYAFGSWSDGGAQNHVITTPAANATYTAVFTSSSSGGLIGYWPFDEGAGTTAADTSGGGHNGVVNGASWTAGKVNSALSFNGTTSSVVTPAIPLGRRLFRVGLGEPRGATQKAYARIAETRYDGGLYLGTNASGAKYKFIVNTGLGATGKCGAAYGCAEGGTVTAGWHLVTATFDGSTGRLYVDSVLVASETFTAPPNTNYPLYVGRMLRFGVDTAGMAPSMKSVCTTVRCRVRRLRDFMDHRSGGLIGYWAFDEGSGTTAADTSGDNYNGVVNGASWTAGKVNSALSFNGTTSSVVTPGISLGNAFSVSAWVNPASRLRRHM